MFFGYAATLPASSVGGSLVRDPIVLFALASVVTVVVAYVVYVEAAGMHENNTNKCVTSKNLRGSRTSTPIREVPTSKT